MKYALISPLEPRESGYRVCQVNDSEFEVGDPLFWVQCADDIVGDEYWYDPVNQTFELIPPPPEPPAPPEPVVEGAQPL